jgi:hypothetical protein
VAFKLRTMRIGVHNDRQPRMEPWDGPIRGHFGDGKARRVHPLIDASIVPKQIEPPGGGSMKWLLNVRDG